MKNPKEKDLTNLTSSNDKEIKPIKREDPKFIEKQFFSQEIAFVRGENKTMEISLKFMKEQPADAKDDNIIFVELYGANELNKEEDDLILSSRLFIQG